MLTPVSQSPANEPWFGLVNCALMFTQYTLTQLFALANCVQISSQHGSQYNQRLVAAGGVETSWWCLSRELSSGKFSGFFRKPEIYVETSLCDPQCWLLWRWHGVVSRIYETCRIVRSHVVHIVWLRRLGIGRSLITSESRSCFMWKRDIQTNIFAVCDPAPRPPAHAILLRPTNRDPVSDSKRQPNRKVKWSFDTQGHYIPWHHQRSGQLPPMFEHSMHNSSVSIQTWAQRYICSQAHSHFLIPWPLLLESNHFAPMWSEICT